MQQGERHRIGRHIGPPAGFAEQPGDQNHKSGLEKLRRLDVDAEDHQPAPRALDLGAEMRRGRDQREADQEDEQRKLADLARRQERGRNQHRRRGNEEEHLPVDEVERVEADARGDRRACGQAENDAAEHQRAERSQRQPIDRPPPFAQGRGLRARRHDIPKAESPKVIPLSGGTGVVYMGLRRGRIWATRRFGSPAAVIGSWFPEVERHEDAVRIGQVTAKRRAFDKAVLAIERPRGPKIVPGTRFQAQP